MTCATIIVEKYLVRKSFQTRVCVILADIDDYFTNLSGVFVAEKYFLRHTLGQ
ncbi:MAG: hypothetical protein RR993_04360 [Clostridia bacterium]